MKHRVDLLPRVLLPYVALHSLTRTEIPLNQKAARAGTVFRIEGIEPEGKAH